MILRGSQNNELQNECNRICHNKPIHKYNCNEIVEIGEALAKYLLKQENVNFIWSFTDPYNGRGSLVEYISFLNRDTAASLVTSGLDLNPIVHDGIASLTSIIGNAENTSVAYLLSLAKLQTSEQREVWINKTDSMTRFDMHSALCYCGWFSKPIYTHVRQTALQLTIAKGYKDLCGESEPLRISNLELAKQLLALGAVHGINYQEPAKGNTALHMACARRDFEATELLIANGASLQIRNNEGQLPLDMLKLSFKQASRLLEFHTSPDGHPNTFCLDKEEFNCKENLEKLRTMLSNPLQHHRLL